MVIRKSHLPRIAEAIAAYLKEHAPTGHAAVLAFSGDLGAGKTTFIQELARSLGVQEHVPSPTFVIMKRYHTADPVFKQMIHIDAYRMESAAELAPLKLSDVFAQNDTLVCVEWPERMFGMLPADVTKVTLSVAGEDERVLTTNPALRAYMERFLAAN